MKDLGLHPQLNNIALLFKSAIEEDVSPLEMIIELAGFGATYALMPRAGNAPISVAKLIGDGVMAGTGRNQWESTLALEA